MSAQELLPCPFCGGDPHIDGTSWTTRDGKDQSWVTCKKCGAYGPSAPDCAAAWNRRTPEVQALIAAAQLEERERCARVVEKRAEAYDRDFGIYDYSTGITEYPGTGSESMEEWEAIAAAIRALKKGK